MLLPVFNEFEFDTGCSVCNALKSESASSSFICDMTLDVRQAQISISRAVHTDDIANNALSSSFRLVEANGVDIL